MRGIFSKLAAVLAIMAWLPAALLYAPAALLYAPAARADDKCRLLAEVATLPEAYREVLLLYYYDDVTYQEVAEILGVSAATVNARLTKGRALLRERLSGMQR